MFDQNNGTNDQVFGYADYSFPPPVQGVPIPDEDTIGGTASNTVTLGGTVGQPA